MERMSIIRARVILAALPALWLAVSSPVRADGLVIVPPHPGLPNPTQLAVRYHDVEITIREQVASVAIDQVFRNLNAIQVEGEYLFPIPDGAAVSDFALYVDGEPIHAEAMDATEALRIYENHIRQNRDPALLEYAGRELFRARIFPFPANGDRRVTLDYDQVVEREGGLYRFTYPLSTEKFSSRPLESAVVKIELSADRPIRNAYCPTHAVDIEYVDSRHLRLSWEENGTTPDRDLVFYYSLAEGALDMNLVPYRPEDRDDGYFMLLASMGSDNEIPIAPKDVVFVLDHSGSMRGVKIEQARDAVVYCLNHLNPRDRFNVVAFSTEVDAFAEDLVAVARDRTGAAADFVARLEAEGSTDISAALARALEARFSRERPGFIVFVTDGLPTEGERDPRRILAQVERDDRGVRVFPFGVGYDVNAPFLDQLAIENAASPTYVRETEDLASRVSGFYDQISDPVMTDVEVHVAGTRFRDLQPARPPDIFRGSQLVLFGRYRGTGPLEVTLTGRVDGEQRTFRTTVDLPRRDDENAFVGRLWATRRIGSLLRRIRLYGEESELIAEVKTLGLRFGIATPYTSFLVDEDAGEGKGPLADGARSWQAIEATSARHAADAFASQSSGRSAGVRLSAVPLMQAPTGEVAFEVSKKVEAMASASSEASGPAPSSVRVVQGHTFRREGDVWKDVDYTAGTQTTKVKVGSEEYFRLLVTRRGIGHVLALGERVIFEVDGRWYETVTGD